jgi:hypothetical protein
VQAAKEWCAPSAYCKDAAKKYHGIDTQPSLPGPVGIGFHVEPKRKFIQGKRRAHSVADRHQAAQEYGERRVRAAQVEQPAVTNQQQNQNAPHKMVNMMSTHHHPLKRPALMHDRTHKQAHANKGDKERYRRQEHAPPGPVRDGAAYQKSKSCEV